MKRSCSAGDGADLGDGHGDLDADVAAADDHNVLAEPGLALEHVPGVDDVGALLVGMGGMTALEPAAMTTPVKVLGGGQDVLGGGLLVEDYLNAQGAALALEPLAEIADVIAPRGAWRRRGRGPGCGCAFPRW